MAQFKGVCVGAGYFSHFQYEAWQRIPEVTITAMCNRNPERAQAIMDNFGIANHYTDYREMLETEKPDFVDIITPPPTHLEMCKVAADLGIHVICQKPLAPTFDEAKQIVEHTGKANIRFMVHENWRFQPWYREIKRLLDDGAIGEKIHVMSFRSRMGDGWGDDAYLNRQPYFRDYPRLLVYENGVHFIDTYRYLAGEITSVYAVLKKFNPVIAGEDFAMVTFNFASGATGLWDANRYNESNMPNPRYTFGEFLVDGNAGSIRLYSDGHLTVQELGKPETEHAYQHEDRNFAGDCCYTTQRHFVDHLIDGGEFETNGPNYLRTLAVQDAVYRSEEQGLPVQVPSV
ncbi:MAG: Gfo/Idh/MocA family oxidoreductase [Phycisphaerales bacterium]|nr:MAG: Gfo/Idh/MocA family oxidoreductase [Phycisphaerales bacterium]